jgi:hypothetical protein
MLDTVMVKFHCTLRVRLRGRQKLTLALGIKVCADASGESLEKAEFSLPKLLFGHNGRVLSSQREIDAALEHASHLLSEIATVPDVIDWDARRVDMAWNYAMSALPLILAHASLRVPGILHGATLHRAGEGVSWRGGKSHKMVTLYDKARRMRVAGSVLRAEVSLRSGQILRHLPGAEWRSFDSLYRVYRSLLSGIPAISRPLEAASFLQAIGLEAPETRNRILSRLAHKPGRSFRRYRQQVETAATQLERTFSWSELLPESAPPPAMHVIPCDRRRYRTTLTRDLGSQAMTGFGITTLLRPISREPGSNTPATHPRGAGPTDYVTAG